MAVCFAGLQRVAVTHLPSSANAVRSALSVNQWCLLELANALRTVTVLVLSALSGKRAAAGEATGIKSSQRLSSSKSLSSRATRPLNDRTSFNYLANELVFLNETHERNPRPLAGVSFGWRGGTRQQTDSGGSRGLYSSNRTPTIVVYPP